MGKTTLINEFIKDKDSIFFAASETNGKQNLCELSKAITKDGSIFPDFKTALEAVFKLAENQRIIFVIDEYPYLAGCSKGISSVLQHIIDREHQNSKLFIIICGSSVSFMENQVLGYKSPLFGRRTAQFRVKPFDFVGSREFFPNYNSRDAALAYGITGGIPLYMAKINDSLPLSENIKQGFFDTAGYFYEEPTNLIKQECREPAQYNSIISAIAGGASRLSEIATKIGNEKTSVVSGYLNTLIEIGIVKKETPFGEKNSRRTIYTVSDSMFRFWYRFVLSRFAHINGAVGQGLCLD